jgi:hypothetical protein
MAPGAALGAVRYARNHVKMVHAHSMARLYEQVAVATASSERRRAAGTADAKRFRLKAVELRAIADTLSDPAAHSDLSKLAEQYDQMAAQRERSDA